ncbi:MAG: succinate dehydrogenase, hydrophobic membrane anchor protein [Alphaproteobacteria bacterium]|nr:succinate dehydrogenase, hydrophobic membrane anchor protein [Alphaproteobacteria bacterium]
MSKNFSIKKSDNFKGGFDHWWIQRLTALVLIPLSLWFITSLLTHFNQSYQEVISWLSSPLSAFLMMAMMISIFWHAQIGLNTIIEDYVHHSTPKIVLLLINKFLCIFLAGFSCLTLLFIILGDPH